MALSGATNENVLLIGGRVRVRLCEFLNSLELDSNGLLSAHSIDDGRKLYDLNAVEKIDRSRTTLQVH